MDPLISQFQSFNDLIHKGKIARINFRSMASNSLVGLSEVEWGAQLRNNYMAYAVRKCTRGRDKLY